jgi:hypothetical protein
MEIWDTDTVFRLMKCSGLYCVEPKPNLLGDPSNFHAVPTCVRRHQHTFFVTRSLQLSRTQNTMIIPTSKGKTFPTRFAPSGMSYGMLHLFKMLPLICTTSPPLSHEAPSARRTIAPREPKHSRSAVKEILELQLDMGADSLAAESRCLLEISPKNYLRWTLQSKKKNTS